MNKGHIQAERAEAIHKAMNTGTPDNVENVNRERRLRDQWERQRRMDSGAGLAGLSSEDTDNDPSQYAEARSLTSYHDNEG